MRLAYTFAKSMSPSPAVWGLTASVVSPVPVFEARLPTAEMVAGVADATPQVTPIPVPTKPSTRANAPSAPPNRLRHDCSKLSS